MSHLVIEILLRLTKVVLAGIVALLIYGVATWVDPSAAGATLGVAALAAAAGIVLLLESSPL
jgi:hypothetical protein